MQYTMYATYLFFMTLAHAIGKLTRGHYAALYDFIMACGRDDISCASTEASGGMEASKHGRSVRLLPLTFQFSRLLLTSE